MGGAFSTFLGAGGSREHQAAWQHIRRQDAKVEAQVERYAFAPRMQAPRLRRSFPLQPPPSWRPGLSEARREKLEESQTPEAQKRPGLRRLRLLQGSGCLGRLKRTFPTRLLGLGMYFEVLYRACCKSPAQGSSSKTQPVRLHAFERLGCSSCQNLGAL